MRIDGALDEMTECVWGSASSGWPEFPTNIRGGSMMRQKNTTGTDYVYGRIDQDVALAYSHAMGRDIPDYNYYIDAPGETKQLDALLDTVRA